MQEGAWDPQAGAAAHTHPSRGPDTHTPTRAHEANETVTLIEEEWEAVQGGSDADTAARAGWMPNPIN